MLGHQAEAAIATTGLHQHQFGQQRRAAVQRIPGLLQMGAEMHGDVFTTAAQLAHAIQKHQLRSARRFGTVEQFVVEPGQHLVERPPQRRQRSGAGLRQQPRVAPGMSRWMWVGVHAQLLHTLAGAGMLGNGKWGAGAPPSTACAW